ncbi:MAG TPA: PDDEXK nuclease domain-containing protein [Thermoanaerobaculia bacterium]|nr:PDDEXK nuclease domain-containing protein [Thermoanaerobaculia bacterium]
MTTRRKAAARKPDRSAEPLYREIRAVLEAARSGAYRAVNAAMVQAYWNVGRLIVEHEQQGRHRAGYGEAVIATLAGRLTRDLGPGFDERNLRYMRAFHLAFPILNALRSESPTSGKRNALRSESAIRHAPRDESPGLRSELSWTHYRLLLSVDDPAARDWYMHEAADQHWSTRQLERQISVLYYERLLASRRKPPVRKEAMARLAALEPEQFIRDPYVLEFLDLKDYPALRESSVEQAIIENLQAFLLELGKGFSFVARQKRLRFEEEDFYVDLVFYNYLLKCFVLIDLKVGKLTHQDIGQMDSYVRMFDEHARPEGDNPTIGLILCSRKNEAIAKYSVLSEARQIFAAKYVKVLPTERELTREIERERRLIDARQAERERSR